MIGDRSDASDQAEGDEKLNAETDATLRRIDLTITRLVLTFYQVPSARRAAYLEARRRLRRARVRRFRQLA